MPKGKIEILVEPRSVRVEYLPFQTSPYGRFYWGFGLLAFCVFLLCILIFSSGKHGSTSIWQDLQAHRAGSSDFLVPLGLILAVVAYMVWLLARTLPVAYPGGQRIECNGDMLTVSWVRWLDWKNENWISETYLMKDVCRIRYAVIQSGKGSSTWGLRFEAAGQAYKLFPDLTTHEVGKILGALEALGVETDRKRKAKQRGR